MLLCIKVGNTNLVFGLWEEGKWCAEWRVQTVRDRMSDEYAMLLKTLMRDSGYELGAVTRVAIASVVPQLKTVFLELFHRYLGITPLVLGPGVKTA